ncbi:proline--tRNA ligase [Pseudostreptobacillus hongkongensis]|uniref:proline--tRNA ligase n=1 Tax=Pseudostreptobacillus hongkongensis TaxID=1162717 RepID=UPI0008319753|nr:proline--tRNA ligase [Pseudostreptobacillus hongkongensis]
MRFSKSFIKTYKEVPKDAETVSHKLMLRASMIKQLTRGVYTYLPLGLRVLQKIEKITREEMNRIGAQEVLMPVLQPADLWKESKRWFSYGPELMRLNDRNARDFVLGPTHEEVITDIFRNTVTSYKELPLNIYQIQNKFRDEKRPRFGLMRGREFIMKDAYSFHIGQKSLDEEYNNVKGAYYKIFERCGLNFRAVEADTGSIGGSESHEFMVLASSGEDDILYSNASDYAANVEKATSIIEIKEDNSEELEKELKETPDCKTIEEVSSYLNVPQEKTVKALLLKEILESGENKYFIAMIRGDLDINEVKVKNLVNATLELEMMNESDVENLGLKAGYISGLKDIESIKNGKVKVIADETVIKLKNFVAGANIEGYHYINTNVSDLHIDYVGDIRTARAGDKSPRDEGTLEIARGIEVGHIFKLGKKYSEALGAKVLNDKGIANEVLMGCYGIGISRVSAAAIEQNNDDFGIIWPKSIAPYLVDLILVNSKDEVAFEVSEKLYKEMLSNDIEVIYDDRDEKAGFKFKDADLIGFPLKVIVGKGAKDGIVEIKHRDGSKNLEVKIEDVISYIKEFERS